MRARLLSTATSGHEQIRGRSVLWGSPSGAKFPAEVLGFAHARRCDAHPDSTGGRARPDCRAQRRDLGGFSAPLADPRGARSASTRRGFVGVKVEGQTLRLNVSRKPLGESAPFGECADVIIRDRDTKFGGEFDRVAKGVGMRVVQTPVRMRNMNAKCERFLGGVRQECSVTS